MKVDSPDLVPAYIEAVTYTTQFSADLARGIAGWKQLPSLLKPLVELIRMRDQFRESGGQLPLNHAIQIIEAKRKGLEVERLEISPGDTILIIGEEGGGKTTLVELLAQFPIEFGNCAVGATQHLDKRAYRAGICVCVQKYEPQTASMKRHFQSIVEGRREEKDGAGVVEKMFPYLEKFGFDLLLVGRLREKEKRNAIAIQTGGERDVQERDALLLEKSQDPDKWTRTVLGAADKVILNQDIELSGGQCKLMNIMLADFALSELPKNYHMVMLDEPTAGVTKNAPLVQKVVAGWREKHPDLIMVIVDHAGQPFFENPPAGDKTRVLGIKDGKLVQDVLLSVAKKQDGVYRDLKSFVKTTR